MTAGNRPAHFPNMSTNPENTHTSPETCERDAQVERWEPSIILEGQMSLNRYGSYVTFTDFESVRQERDAFKSERDRLRAALEQVVSLAESIDLSPCCGGSCMVATDADDIVGPLQRAARAALNQSDAQ